ncbi:ATP synthase delta chain [hydrothermal vent metagenome]|uniref:ATP synthase delta chain n=1 Tax=hydrothermal vent metagenome TaxID=652676 RepID=A0A3B0YHY8_9ZZZZ
MAELITLARPYAQAVYKMASEKKTLPHWSEILDKLLQVISHESIAALIDNSKVSRQELTDVITAVCGDEVDQEGKNLVALLIENGRIELIPEIVAVYEHLRAEAESTVEAEVRSAFPIAEDQQQKIAQALKARLGCEVKIKSIVDKSVVGGAIIRAGDLVIDGSVTGKLAKLGHALNL